MRSELLQKMLVEDIPLGARIAALKGLLPLNLHERILLCLLWRKDQEDSLRVAAKEGLLQVKDKEWVKVVPLLDESHVSAWRFLGGQALRNLPLARTIILGKNAPPSLLIALASRLDGPGLEMLVTHQVHLQKFPGIVVTLLKNANLGRDQRRRLRDFSEQFLSNHPGVVSAFAKLGLELKPKPTPPIPDSKTPEPQLPPKADESEAVAPLEKASEEGGAPDTEVTGDEADPGTTGEVGEEGVEPEVEEEEVDTDNIFQKILKMTIPKKIEMALKGSKEARGILIRESNKVIQQAVIDSPKLSESEISGLVRMRHLRPEIFRSMASKRNWMKKYDVVVGLIQNPKVPFTITRPLLQRLILRDLKSLSKAKGISEVLRRAAQRMYRIKTEKK